MEIWLKGASRRLRIPVLPPGYTVSSGQQNQTVNIVGLGEVTLRGKRGLLNISFSSFFPKQYDASYCETSSLRSPKEYVSIIESMKRSGTVKLIITGTTVNFRCTIESFDWSEDDGTRNINYTISLKEYRAPSASKSAVVTVGSEAAAGTAESDSEGGRTVPDPKVKTYVVKEGDTLSSIAQQQTGKVTQTLALYLQNQDTIGANPNRITPGMVLTIPAV